MLQSFSEMQYDVGGVSLTWEWGAWTSSEVTKHTLSLLPSQHVHSTLGLKEERGEEHSRAFSELWQEALLSQVMVGSNHRLCGGLERKPLHLAVISDASFLLGESPGHLCPPCFGRTDAILSCEAGKNLAFHSVLLFPPSFQSLL